jgi:hypothetical protein
VSGPRIGSLFSGYGGIDLGLRELWPDAETVWVSDIEKGPIVITLADDWAEVVAISESWAENQCPHNSEARAFPSSIAALLQASSTTPTLKETHK